MRGDGSGTTLYLGEHRGARFVGIDLRGFNGWTSRPRWLKHGCEFYNPTVHVGRLFMDEPRMWSTTVLLPYRPVRLWRMRKRAYREAMREQPLTAA
jgi:hypothetical protein